MPGPERERRPVTLKQRVGLRPVHPGDLRIHPEIAEYSDLLLAYQLGSTRLRQTYETYSGSSARKDGVFYTTIRMIKDVGELELGTEARVVVNPERNEVRLNFGGKWYVVTADPIRWQDGGYHPGTLEDITEDVAREEAEKAAHREELERQAAQRRQPNRRIKELEGRLAESLSREESLRKHIVEINEAHTLEVERLKEELARANVQAHEVFGLFLGARFEKTIVEKLAEQYSQYVGLEDFTYCGTLAIQIVDQIYGAPGPAWNEGNRQFTIHVVACWLHTFSRGTIKN